MVEPQRRASPCRRPIPRWNFKCCLLLLRSGALWPGTQPDTVSVTSPISCRSRSPPAIGHYVSCGIVRWPLLRLQGGERAQGAVCRPLNGVQGINLHHLQMSSPILRHPVSYRAAILDPVEEKRLRSPSSFVQIYFFNALQLIYLLIYREVVQVWACAFSPRLNQKAHNNNNNNSTVVVAMTHSPSLSSSCLAGQVSRPQTAWQPRTWWHFWLRGYMFMWIRLLGLRSQNHYQNAEK